MKNLVSTLSLGAVLVIAPFAANAAATFNTNTTKSVSVSTSLAKGAATTPTVTPNPKGTTLVTAQTLVDAYNDAVDTAYDYVDSRINNLSVSGSTNLTSSITELVQEVMTNNMQVASSWEQLKNSSATAQQQTTAYFETAM